MPWRMKLFHPESLILLRNRQVCNVIYTEHAIFMIFFMVMPVMTGSFGNLIVSIMIGRLDVAAAGHYSVMIGYIFCQNILPTLHICHWWYSFHLQSSCRSVLAGSFGCLNFCKKSAFHLSVQSLISTFVPFGTSDCSQEYDLSRKPLVFYGSKKLLFICSKVVLCGILYHEKLLFIDLDYVHHRINHFSICINMIHIELYTILHFSGRQIWSHRISMFMQSSAFVSVVQDQFRNTHSLACWSFGASWE